MINKIHLGKWEDVMPKISDGIIDLIITSPPYNVSLGIDNKYKKDSYAEYDDNLPYDDYLNWITQLFIECNRVLKNGGRICINIADAANGSIPTHVDFTYRLLNLTKFSKKLKNNFENFQMMTTIVWNKKQMGSSTSWGSWKSPSSPSFPTQFEYIIIAAKGTRKRDGDKNKITVSRDDFIKNSRALWEFNPETEMMKRYEHPAMFPMELPRRCIDQLSYQNDIVLDPFSGAGTTCVVAKQMARQYIGIEMTPKYYYKSLERLSLIPNSIIDVDGNTKPEWMF